MRYMHIGWGVSTLHLVGAITRPLVRDERGREKRTSVKANGSYMRATHGLRGGDKRSSAAKVWSYHQWLQRAPSLQVLIRLAKLAGLIYLSAIPIVKPGRGRREHHALEVVSQRMCTYWFFSPAFFVQVSA